ANANNSLLLKKALDAGQISILDYIVEIGLYYNTVNQALQAELGYQKAFAQLSSIEL
ncbi:MAG: transporter, partial [Bacteroides sp.]